MELLIQNYLLQNSVYSEAGHEISNFCARQAAKTLKLTRKLVKAGSPPLA